MKSEIKTLRVYRIRYWTEQTIYTVAASLREAAEMIYPADHLDGYSWFDNEDGKNEPAKLLFIKNPVGDLVCTVSVTGITEKPQSAAKFLEAINATHAATILHRVYDDAMVNLTPETEDAMQAAFANASAAVDAARLAAAHAAAATRAVVSAEEGAADAPVYSALAAELRNSQDDAAKKASAAFAESLEALEAVAVLTGATTTPETAYKRVEPIIDCRTLMIARKGLEAIKDCGSDVLNGTYAVHEMIHANNDAETEKGLQYCADGSMILVTFAIAAFGGIVATYANANGFDARRELKAIEDLGNLCVEFGETGEGRNKVVAAITETFDTIAALHHEIIKMSEVDGK